MVATETTLNIKEEVLALQEPHELMVNKTRQNIKII
jgi:hypothetical protein